MLAPIMSESLESVGYGFVGLVFLVLVLLLFVGGRGRAQSGMLLAALTISALWGGALALRPLSPGLSVAWILILELFFDAAWLLFLAALLKGSVANTKERLFRFGALGLTGLLLVFGLVAESRSAAGSSYSGAAGVLMLGSVFTSLYGLVGIEQVYRNARVPQRYGLKYLCLGLGGIFVYDLLFYSNSILAGEVGYVGWAARGFVVAMCVPLVAVGARRAAPSASGLFVSRHIVFYGATLFGAGIYLTLAGVMGYYIRAGGGDWGSLAQLLFLAATVIALSLLLISTRLRAWLRVFISKHFFENRYDYREEWLRLIDTLTAPHDVLPLKRRGIKALAQIVDAESGLLWMADADGQQFDSVASWNSPPIDSSIAADGSLPSYLQKTGWVIERAEYDRDPRRYSALDLTEIAVSLPDFEIIVPLPHEEELLGFVLIGDRSSARSLTFEDRDLLKTAGKQVASYLAQERATEQLAESRQFEAFNKFTAYVMHDLKNVIAQNSLIVENAGRHRNNPKFIDDSIATIKAGVARMRRVIEQLQQGTSARSSQRIELGKVIMRAVSQCADREPVPRALIGERQVWVRADAERLQMAIYHAVRNAQDATDSNGDVAVTLRPEGSECVVSVTDSGHGMDDDFIRDRLFRPFDSTKGTSGMGIGAHQIRDTVRAAGGRVDVSSERGKGTRFDMVLEMDA